MVFHLSSFLCVAFLLLSRAQDAATQSCAASGVGDIIQMSFLGCRITQLAKPADEAKAQHEQSLLAKHLKSLDEDELAMLKELEVKAQRYVRSSVKLIVEPERQQVLQDELKSSALGTLLNNTIGKGTIVIIYDQKCAGESATAPHLRVPPLKVERIKWAVQSSCTFMESALELPANAVFAFFDAGKGGNERSILNCFVNEAGATLAKHHSPCLLSTRNQILPRGWRGSRAHAS